MIAIDNILISDEVVEEQFVCDLSRCLGGCCVDGDCGAPLTKEELPILAELYPRIKHLLPEESIPVIEQQGTAVWDDEHGDVTPTIGGGVCVYGYRDAAGVVKCAIERAYNEGLTDWKKPISCHLFPIRITKGEDDFEAVNYEPRELLCKPACRLGKKLKVPVYKFLKEPIIRKYGEDFYEVLDQIATTYKGSP